MAATGSPMASEAAVCDAVSRFQQEFMGRGPRAIHTHLVENRLFVHLEGVLTAKNVPQGTDKDVYEAYFQFAAIWAFGGAFGADKANDFRKLFSEWWRMEWGKMNFKFPDEGLVFDYFIDDVDKKGKHWRDVIPKYTHVLGEGASFSSIVVPTLDTTRLTFLIDDLATRAKPVMLVGGAGTGSVVGGAGLGSASTSMDVGVVAVVGAGLGESTCMGRGLGSSAGSACTLNFCGGGQKFRS